MVQAHPSGSSCIHLSKEVFSKQALSDKVLSGLHVLESNQWFAPCCKHCMSVYEGVSCLKTLSLDKSLLVKRFVLTKNIIL